MPILQNSSTTITIPGHDVELTAVYLDASKVVKYPLAVNNGSGSGDYIGGANVFINADAPASGYAFSHWSGDNDILTDSTQASNALVMPDRPVTLTANYKSIVKYRLTLTFGFIQGSGGSTSGMYQQGDVLKIVAQTPPAGKIFISWTGDVSGLSDYTAATSTLSMPASDVNLTATYADLSVYSVTVYNGAGQTVQQYLPDVNVSVSPDFLWDKAFDYWTGDLSAVGLDGLSQILSFKMPAQPLTFTANYKNVQGTIEFTAIDENNNQLEDVKVEAIGKESYEAYTNVSGLAGLTMNYDNYSIAFTKEGYESNSMSYKLETSSEQLTVKLKKVSGVEPESFTGIILYPVPASNVLFLNIDNSKWDGAAMSMYDFTGKCVRNETTLTSGVNRISVEHLASGFYFIRLNTGTETITMKFTKE